MANEHKEPNQGADTGGLENLPDAEQKETKGILDEIEKEEKARAPVPPVVDPPKPPEVPVVDPKKPADPKPDGEGKDKNQPEARREVKLIPEWEVNIERKRNATEKKELLDQIEKLSQTAPTKPEEGNKGDPQKYEDWKSEAAKKLAERAEAEGLSPELIGDILDAAVKRAGILPPEVAETIQTAQKLNNDRAVEVETAKFNSDFDRVVVPLIKAEYGSDVPETVISDIKEKVKGHAYSADYGKVPYSVIYNGVQEFRGIIPPKKNGAERPRGDTPAAIPEATDGPDLNSALSEEEVNKLSPKDFDTWSDNMEKKEKTGRR